jgi:hypothetical protein
MLHAVIRSGPETLHFISRASAENLREITRHLSRMSSDESPTSLELSLDFTDYKVTRLVRRWKKRKKGAPIHLRVRRIRRLRPVEPPLAKLSRIPSGSFQR